MTDTVVVLVTAPSTEEAARIARVLVEEKLAACGNVVPGVRSIYRWQGKICDEQEALLVLKAPRKQFPALRDRVVALHPVRGAGGDRARHRGWEREVPRLDRAEHVLTQPSPRPSRKRGEEVGGRP